MLTVASSEAILDRSNVHGWYKMFSEVREDVNDEERTGHSPWVFIVFRKNYGLVLFMDRRRHWAVLLPWWSRPARYCEWESLPFNDNRIFLAPIEWYGLGGHVVPRGRRHKPHSECRNQFIGNQVWRTCYLTKWSCRLPALVVRFNAGRLFPVWLRQVYGLCQQVSDDWWALYEFRTWNCIWADYMAPSVF